MTLPTALRVPACIGGGAIVLMLGLIELTSMAFYGDLARAPAFPALLPAGLGYALARPLRSPHLPPQVRVAYARALLHRGEGAQAAAIVATLPDDADAADVRGQLAELAGRPIAALDAFARAGDYSRAQRLIDLRAAAGEEAQAATYEAALADALRGNGQAAVRAQALWRLGQITEAQALRSAPNRSALERKALDAYEQALAIAPNEETYLLAAGQQALVIGDKAAAFRYYTRALDAVPDSVDARIGRDRARP